MSVRLAEVAFAIRPLLIGKEGFLDFPGQPCQEDFLLQTTLLVLKRLDLPVGNTV